MAWYDKQSLSEITYFVKGGRLPLLSFNEFSKKSAIALLPYTFREMVFISQNLNHVHKMHFFHELLIFVWLILIDILLKLVSHHIREMLHIATPKDTNDDVKAKREIFLTVSDVDVEEYYLFFECTVTHSSSIIWNFPQFQGYISLTLWSIKQLLHMHLLRCELQQIYKETSLLFSPNIFLFLTPYFGDAYCLMYEKSNWLVYIFVF